MSIPALKDSVEIVASDLDGTLLAPNHQLSDFTKLTLKKLHDQGYTFIFATGRHHVDVAGIRQIAGIPAYMITSNGARVHDQNDQLMYSQNVPQELVQPVIDIVRQDPNIFIHMYQNEDWLLDREDEMLAQFHSESGFSYKRFEAENAPSESIAKVFFTHPEQDHEYLVTFEQKLRGAFGDKLNIAFSTPWCLEVMAAEVSKGHALDAVAKSLNLTLDNCVAFGDGMNDAEMLAMAGKGLIMGTSHEKVMKALPDNEVIGSNADDAVAHYLEKHLL
ncbi:Cof-type HAD-IIB family hydrolase [Vibrio sp. 10N.261.46.E12]|uniref:Cof-type HAD-IIB family hydrolase n=1 Tax=unclassified Vibrio TaxID=2614977 RepID=UPI000975D0AB|nr:MULTISPECIES: Cof-type HAD-IIB family hydrolase [unclassified Vibrio]OMO37601.1 sugar/pyridoxal phosphate phosphatase YigL [Vibrio sp. 10N.261.45.E1]PMJ37335.1 sugar/pyridoxal phosphate phosphatase YigL [Vibrio sp. 10N.286.45.B6]PML86583.1 sugar/pyridoxal phosphate phosphatase YigL [Vibrio sp. 10N.261.49.E11]PMM69364.1 sugar/pyridoxal phosphate phosphatase YigL [Vibrio sp. 10N.261.46.F12]PMM79208.1 sugar/pyridoxal phosphate phosphatase YigL [Vibrio sp. 10N.261.46.E8]